MDEYSGRGTIRLDLFFHRRPFPFSGTSKYITSVFQIVNNKFIKYSTCSQLLECVNDWTIELNFRHSMKVAYKDFQKAFDSFVHSKLCHKLKCYDVSDKLLNWLTDFLVNVSKLSGLIINYQIIFQSRVVFIRAASLVQFFL